MGKKTNRIVIGFDDEAMSKLKKLMRFRGMNSRPEFLSALIAEEYNRGGKKTIEEATEEEYILPSERDYSDDLPKDEVWAGLQVGPREYRDRKKHDKELRARMNG